MGKVTWSENDVDILKLHFESKGSKYCQKLLSKDRSLKLISTKARRLGLSKNKKWSEKEDSLLIKMWSSSSSNKLKEYFPNRTKISLQNRARMLNLSVEDKGVRRRQTDISYLNLENLTRNSTYWWGLLLADGYLGKRGELSLYLHVDDIHHLEKFALAVNSKISNTSSDNLKVVTCVNKLEVDNFKKQLKLKNDCTKTYCPPDLKVFDNFKLELLIGLIDGDGHIRFSNGHYSIYVEMFNTWSNILEDYSKYLFERYEITSKVEFTKKGKYTRFKIVGKSNLLKIKKLVLDLPYLSRKWDKIDIEQL